MWLVWKKYSKVFVFLSFLCACNSSKENQQKEIGAFLDSLTVFKNFTGKVLVFSESECIGCSLNKNILKIGKSIHPSDSVRVVIFRSTKGQMDLHKLKEAFPKVRYYGFIKNIKFMISLAEITQKKSGPYLLEYKAGNIKSIESFGTE
jgi:hypothetical protein